MGWIKRNLFFAIGVLVAIGMLGAAGFYDYKSWGHNQAAFANLNEVYTTLSEAAKQKPSPGNDKVDNIAAAKDQDRQLRQWIGQARKYFEPIPRIPTNGPLSNEVFGHALTATIKQLQDASVAANVQLPPQYPFSFTTDVGRITFAPGSLEPLSVQLGEVKAITEILFAARVNALDGIQRVRVSDDDTSGPQTDYLDDQPVKTDLADLVPYEVTFRAFSAEIARVLEGFANSPHGFIVNTISVQPAGTAGLTSTDSGGYPPVTPMPAGGRFGYDTGTPPPSAAPAGAGSGKGGLQAALNEQLLRVTLTVEVVKLTQRN